MPSKKVNEIAIGLNKSVVSETTGVVPEATARHATKGRPTALKQLAARCLPEQSFFR